MGDILTEARRHKRMRWSKPATIKGSRSQSKGKIVNISETGMCVKLLQNIHAQTLEEVDIHTRDMGMFTGKIIWMRNLHIGLDIRLNTNVSAKLRCILRGGEDLLPNGK